MPYRALHRPHDDSPDAGREINTCLTVSTLGALAPELRRLLTGRQVFVRQRDGTWRPKGSPLGLARCFESAQLQPPAPPHPGDFAEPGGSGVPSGFATSSL